MLAITKKFDSLDMLRVKGESQSMQLVEDTFLSREKNKMAASECLR